MCARPATRAAATGSRPLVDAPSDSSTIAAGGLRFALPLVAFSTVVAVAIASPLAVPPLGPIRAIALRTASRSVVGLARTRGVWLNAITPTFTRAGTLRRNARAARFAATRRVGDTSAEVIE